MTSTHPSPDVKKVTLLELILASILVVWVVTSIFTVVYWIFPYGDGPICGYVIDVIDQEYGSSYVSLFQDRTQPDLYEASALVTEEKEDLKGQYGCFRVEKSWYSPHRYYLTGIQAVYTQN